MSVVDYGKKTNPVALAGKQDILHDPRASGAAIRTFERIAERWKLDPKQRAVLLGLEESDYSVSIEKPNEAHLRPDTLERISYILGIYKAINTLLPRREAADEWIRRKNDAMTFKGSVPLEMMLHGHVMDLYQVRRYLDTALG